HFEYRLALLAAARADEGAQAHPQAVAALEKFKTDHADAWQLVPLRRVLGRILLEKEPPDFEAARKAYDDLARAGGVPADVRQEFTFLVIDLLLQANRLPEARQRLAELPADLPRVPLYRIGVQATPATLAEAV